MSGSLAAEFVQIGVARVQAGKCLQCEGGYSPVGMPGMQPLGIGLWACTCEAGREVLRRYQARAQAQEVVEMLAGAELPAKFAECTLDSFRARVGKMVEKVKAHREVCEWLRGGEGERGSKGAEERKPWLFLYGGTGRGKTGLGVGVLKRLIAVQQVAGRFISTFDMFDEMKRRFNGNVEEYVDALARVPVLMVDELVTPYRSIWRTQMLFDLVWRRDAAQLTTIWTCGDVGKVEEVVTEAGWRRLRDNSLRVELGGKEIDWGK